jgi:hypothetical protein
MRPVVPGANLPLEPAALRSVNAIAAVSIPSVLIILAIAEL